MATIVQSYSVKRAGAKAPVSTHPAFLAIVALWFAALLGLGSLVLPVALLERLVTVTRIAALVPSAAPPLGFTARVAIALAGAIAGAGVGLLLARQVARSRTAELSAPRRAAGAERECRPISAHDELGDEGLGPSVSAPPVQRRRSLAMADDDRGSEHLEGVPLPGLADEDQASVCVVGEEPNEEFRPSATYDQRADAGHELLELGAFAEADDTYEHDDSMTETEARVEELGRRVLSPAVPAMEELPMTDHPTFDRYAAFDEDEGERQQFRPARQAAIPQACDPEPDGFDPLPFAPPSLRRAEPVASDEDEAFEELHKDERLADESAPQLMIVTAASEPAAADDRPLAELGLVQLAARLGASIEKRRAHLAQRHGAGLAPLPVTTPLADEDFEAVGPEDAARAIADFFGPGTPSEPKQAAPDPAPAVANVPARLHSFALYGDDEDDDDDEAFAASFSLLRAARPAAKLDAADEDEAEEDDGDDSDYSSLLAMKNPFVRQQEFVRVDEPENESDGVEPTVTFPSRTPAEPAQPTRQRASDSVARASDVRGKPAESAVRSAPVAVPREPDDAERSLGTRSPRYSG